MTSSSYLRRAIVDSGPLFSVLTLEYLRRTKAGADMRKSVLNRNKLSDYLQDPIRQDRLLTLFEGIKSIVITSHVVGEVQGLQRLTGDLQRAFWESAYGFFTEKNLEEHLLNLLTLCSDGTFLRLVGEIGPTDAGLIHLALGEGCTLLTDDERTLARYAWGTGKVDCRLVGTIL